MKKHIHLIIVLLLSASVNLVTAQTSNNFDVSKRLDSLYTELYKYGEFNGNVLVAEDGKEMYFKSFGISDADNNVPLKRNSIFYLASVSKQFTALSILLLEKKNQLSYTDDISKYLPELEFYKGIKIENLIYHTSGLPDYTTLFETSGKDSITVTNNDIIKKLAEVKPEVRFEPGEKFEYSNTGYLLLASIIERISNQKFGEYLEEHIFNPLKMKDSRLLLLQEVKIEWKENQVVKAYYKYPEDLDYVRKYEGVYGQAKIYSSVEDLLKWDSALRGNSFIKEEDKELIFSSGKLNSGELTGYGFGWYLKQEEPYGKLAYHSGYWPGYLTYIDRHIDHGFTIILLQNNDNRTEKIRLPISETRKILYNLPLKKDFRLTNKTLEKYAGTYVTENGKDVHITMRHFSLWTDGEDELVPINETKFRVNGFMPEVTYTFILDKDGSVESYRIQQIEQGLDKTSMRKE